MTEPPGRGPQGVAAFSGTVDADTFRLLLEALPLAVFVLSTSDRRIIEVNAAAARLVGEPDPASLPGRCLTDFVPANARDALLARQASLLGGEAVAPAQGRMLTPGGEVVPVEHSMLAGSCGGEPVLISVVRDLREAKRAEHALRESETRLMDFAESCSDYLWELDEELRLRFVSKRVAEATGVPRDALLGRTREEIFSQRLHPGDRADVERFEAHYAALRRREPYRDFEYRWLGDDGAYRTLRNSGKPTFDQDGRFTGYRGVGIDITDRAAAERVLGEERERFVRAERTARFGYWQWDCDNGEVTWSDGLYDMFQLDRETVRAGQTAALEVCHPDDRELVRESLRRCQRDQAPFSIEARLGGTRGAIGHVRITGECELRQDGRAPRVFGVVQDLSETRRVEVLLRDAVDGVPAGMALYGPDDRLVMFNEAYRGNRAPEPAALLRPGMKFEDVVRAAMRARRAADRSGEAYFEWRMQTHRNPSGPLLLEHPNGSWTETVEHRTRDGCTFVFRVDVTERERLLRTLRENEKRFRAIASATPYALCVSSLAEGTISYANEAFVRTFAIEDDVARHSTHEFEPEPAGWEWGAAHQTDPASTLTEEVAMRRANGESFWGLVCCVPIEFEGVSSLLSSVVDITRRKESEAELARYREQLEELVAERTRALEEAQSGLVRGERLAAIGQLTGTVAHELRNPLGTIKATFAAVRARLVADEWTERRFDRIDRNIRRCLLIIDELLDFARHRPLVTKETSIDEWCERVLSGTPPPDGVEVLASLESGAMLMVDRDRLRQAFLNVVDNAYQALEDRPGGAVGGHVRLATRRVAGRVEIRVSDDGPGVPHEMHAKIFEPLFSTKSFGIGLGLPLVKQVMEQHGGAVSVEDADGGGTTVVLWLPDTSSLDATPPSKPGALPASRSNA